MDDLTTLIAAASAVAALLSALYAASSARSAAKALSLMRKDRNDKEMGLNAYLVDSGLFALPAGKQAIAMACTLTNLASVPNSLVAVELHIYEYQTSGTPLKLVLRPSEDASFVPWSIGRFAMPLNLEPRSSASGWLAFVLPEAFGIGRAIDKCELLFSSATGDQASVETYLLKEVQYVRDQD